MKKIRSITQQQRKTDYSKLEKEMNQQLYDYKRHNLDDSISFTNNFSQFILNNSTLKQNTDIQAPEENIAQNKLQKLENNQSLKKLNQISEEKPIEQIDLNKSIIYENQSPNNNASKKDFFNEPYNLQSNQNIQSYTYLNTEPSPELQTDPQEPLTKNLIFSSNFFQTQTNLNSTYAKTINKNNNFVDTEQIQNNQQKEIRAKLVDLYENNKNYFDHLKGNCKCSKCNCNKCKCPQQEVKYDYRKTFQTEYLRHTGKIKPLETLQPFKPKVFRESFKMVDLNSTQRESYKKLARKPLTQSHIEIKTVDTIQIGYRPQNYQTSYQNQFIKRIIPQNVLYTPIDNSFVPHQLKNLKQNYKTESMKINKQQFESNLRNLTQINFAQDRQKSINPPTHVQIDRNLISQTNYRKTHINHYQNNNSFIKNKKQQKQLPFFFSKEDFRIKNTHILDQIPGVEGQYLSSSQRDFLPNLLQPCEQAQSKENNNIPQKLPRNAYMFRSYFETKGKYT